MRARVRLRVGVGVGVGARVRVRVRARARARARAKGLGLGLGLTWQVKANMMMDMAGKVSIDGDHSLMGSEGGSGSAMEAHVACTIT